MIGAVTSVSMNNDPIQVFPVLIIIGQHISASAKPESRRPMFSTFEISLALDSPAMTSTSQAENEHSRKRYRSVTISVNRTPRSHRFFTKIRPMKLSGSGHDDWFACIALGSGCFISLVLRTPSTSLNRRPGCDSLLALLAGDRDEGWLKVLAFIASLP